jgi:excisionase family DNA binding protein
MSSREPTFEEMKAKATELYIKEVGENPPDEPFCETLKLKGYWRRARLLLLDKIQIETRPAQAKIVQKVEPISSLLPPKEASRMLGVSYKTLWRWWKEGKIRAVTLPSGRLRYHKDEIERLLTEKP